MKKASRCRLLLPQTQNRNGKLYLAFHRRTCYNVRYLLYIYYAYVNVIDAFVQFLDISYNTPTGVKVFTIAELKKATKVFGDQDMIIEESFGGVVRGYIDPKTLSPSKEGLGIAVVVKMCVLRNGYALKEWLVVSHSDLQDRFIYLHNSPCCVLKT